MGNLSPRSQAYLMPPPIGGLNLRDPFYSMPETDAIQLDNIVPEQSYCRQIGGLEQFIDFGATAVCQTLMTLQNVDGTEKVLAVKIVGGTFDIVEISTGTAISVKGAATVTSGVWQHVVFRNRLFFVNGANQALDWIPGGNVNVTGFTGSFPTNTAINVSAYKSRLYYVQYQSGKIHYGGVDAIAGDTVEFNVTSLLTKGGYVLFAGPTSRFGYDNNDEVFVIYSSQGEVLVYQGDYPNSSTWALIGHYYISPPGSIIYPFRCGFYVGTDLHLLTWDGPIPMSSLMSGADTNNEYTTIAGKVRARFLERSITYSGQQIWQGIYYPAAHYTLINIPLNTNTSEQYGYNTITKAWFRLTGFNIDAWTIFGNILYVSTSLGKVYKFDRLYQGTTINWEIRQAYSFLGAPKNEKEVGLVQPYISLQKGSGGAGTQAVGFAVDYDFEQDSGGTPQNTDLLIDSASAKFNKPFLDARGSARAFSLHMKGAHTSIDLRMFATWLYSKIGGEVA